jgi:hypothetical protein
MSDYYNYLALDDAHPLAAPQVTCRSCGTLVRVDEQIDCECCGERACPTCLVHEDGCWYCPTDTDCGEQRAAADRPAEEFPPAAPERPSKTR